MRKESSYFWLGQFASAGNCDKYFNCQYDILQAPISQFALDLGIKYYDPSQIAYYFKEVDTIGALIDGCPYHEQYGSLITSEAVKTIKHVPNVFVMVNEAAIPFPKTILGKDMMLIYVGRYTYTIGDLPNQSVKSSP